MCDDFMDDCGLDWHDWMIIGPMAEAIAEEERERRRIEREIFEDDYEPPY